VPVEPEAELPPPFPPTVTGTPTLPDVPWPPAVAEGATLVPLAWTDPVEPDELLPPPTCTEPVELDALFPPEPDTETGAETDAPPADVLALAAGVTDVSPTWTVPVDPVALLSARASCAKPSTPASASASRLKAFARMLIPPPKRPGETESRRAPL
jgi:hypothetical protein